MVIRAMFIVQWLRPNVIPNHSSNTNGNRRNRRKDKWLLDQLQHPRSHRRCKYKLH